MKKSLWGKLNEGEHMSPDTLLAASIMLLFLIFSIGALNPTKFNWSDGTLKQADVAESVTIAEEDIIWF